MVTGIIKQAVRRALRSVGYDIFWVGTASQADQREKLRRAFPDFAEEHLDTILAVQDHTVTTPPRIFSLIEAVKHITNNDIPGDIVECGVWKGGSMMAVAHTLRRLKDERRHLFLFDTFEGFPPPGSKDVSFEGETAEHYLAGQAREERGSRWCYAPWGEVSAGMDRVGYKKDHIHLVKGRVEETIPDQAPERIALLRLDTDWYESTHHELMHLYPRLSSGGVLIIDDYGHWRGAREATDEYIARNLLRLLLCRIDYTGRIAIKP